MEALQTLTAAQQIEYLKAQSTSIDIDAAHAPIIARIAGLNTKKATLEVLAELECVELVLHILILFTYTFYHECSLYKCTQARSRTFM